MIFLFVLIVFPYLHLSFHSFFFFTIDFTFSLPYISTFPIPFFLLSSLFLRPIFFSNFLSPSCHFPSFSFPHLSLYGHFLPHNSDILTNSNYMHPWTNNGSIIFIGILKYLELKKLLQIQKVGLD